MQITFGKAKEILAKYASKGGSCPDDAEVDLFVKEVLQYIIYKGPQSALRTYCFQARQGCITLPYELETPIKVKIGDRSGDVWSQWFKYYDTPYLNDDDCLPAFNALYEEGNTYPIVYDVPAGGSQIGVLGICSEADDAHVIVKGVDATGREIFTHHKGEQISGEYLSIVKGQIRVTTASFAKITNVVKTKTNGYVQLLAVDLKANTRCFLADYSPLEEIPAYRRCRLTKRCNENSVITVLGRIRLKENYADSDVIPVENIAALKIAAQGLQLQENNDFQGAAAKDRAVDTLVTQENQYKKVSGGQPLNVYHPTSPGSIQNIVTGSFRRYR